MHVLAAHQYLQIHVHASKINAGCLMLTYVHVHTKVNT